METPVRSLALGGFMGVGKSTIGRLVAEQVAVPFYDLDVEVARRHGPISALLRQSEQRFRTAERATLLDVLERPGPWVLATGGGAWVDPENREALRARCATVVLTAPLPVLAERVGDGDRPLWDAVVEERYRARETAYRDCDWQLDTAGRSPAQLSEEIVAWWSR